MPTPSARLFRIAGFPCSGLDWVGRLVGQHPMVVLIAASSRVGALGGGPPRRGPELAAAGAGLLQQGRAAPAAKPGATHLGVITLAGDSAIAAPEIMVLRDGRDALVAWTIRHLEEDGACLRRFLGQLVPDSRIPELHRRFRADPAGTLARVLDHLELPSAAAPPFDPEASPDTDPGLRPEWEVGRWKRYFTPRAAKLFKMDAWSALESVTGNYGDDE